MNGLPVTASDLRRLRLAHGISVHDLARTVAVTPQHLMELEEGRHAMDDPDVYLRALARILRKRKANA